MQFVDLRVDQPPAARHPMEAFMRETDAVEREALVTWNLTPDGEEYALFSVEGDIERYRERIDTVDSVLDYNLTPVDDGRFYAYVRQATREAESRLRAAFASRNLVVVPPIHYEQDGMHLTVVGAGEDLTALVEAFPEELDVAVEAVGEYDRRHGTLESALTGRQLEAVRTAVRLGYYEVPRTAPLAAVADALGCAESTASTLLRKAERTMLTRLVGSTDEDGPATRDR